jgi:uncharacterized protein
MLAFCFTAMTLDSLILLQAIDLELRRLQADLAELPKRTAAAQAGLQAAQQTLTGARKALAEEEALRRRQELDISSHKSKVERLQRQLNGATSTAQVTALEHEVAFGQGAIAKLEEEEFASLERTEALEAGLQAQEAAHASAEAALQRVQTAAAETKMRNEATIAGLQGERSRLRTELLNPPADWPASTPDAPASLAAYDRVARSKGTGLAEAVPDSAGGGQCSGCRMRVRPQRWHDLASREHRQEIFHCESCGRLLFFDPRRNAPGEQPGIDRLRTALQS